MGTNFPVTVIRYISEKQNVILVIIGEKHENEKSYFLRKTTGGKGSLDAGECVASNPEK